jgi:hypothetical protein
MHILTCILKFDLQLYVTYIILYAVLSAVLGGYVDRSIKKKIDPRQILKYVGGAQFTVLAVVVLASTCIPRGALALNPTSIDGSDRMTNEDAEIASEQGPMGTEAALGKGVAGSPIDSVDEKHSR